MKQIAVIILMMMAAKAAFSATRFEELDKPPEGAHQGQMLLGAFAAIGVPYGRNIDAEHSFVRFSTYTFIPGYVTKIIMIRHLFFNYGIFFEYMPIDHLGIKVKARRTTIVQRTMFGAEYKNWTRMLYNDFSFFLGPTVHSTRRRQWDISLTPFVGYALGQYIATPIAARLINEYEGARKKRINHLAAGIEINLSLFFSGGFFISFGSEWTVDMLRFGSGYLLYNPKNYRTYTGRRSFAMHSICFILSAGYAFSN